MPSSSSPIESKPSSSSPMEPKPFVIGAKLNNDFISLEQLLASEPDLGTHESSVASEPHLGTDPSGKPMTTKSHLSLETKPPWRPQTKTAVEAKKTIKPAIWLGAKLSAKPKYASKGKNTGDS